MNILQGMNESRLRELLFNNQTEPHYNDGSVTETPTTIYRNEYVDFHHVTAMFTYHVPDLKTSPALNLLETTADNLEFWSMSDTGEVTVKRIANRDTTPEKLTVFRIFDQKRLIEAIKLLSPEYGTIEIRKINRKFFYSDGSDSIELVPRTELLIMVGNTRIRWTAIEDFENLNPIRPLINEHEVMSMSRKNINHKDLNKACAAYFNATRNKYNKEDLVSTDQNTTIQILFYSVTHKLNITPSRKCENYMNTYMQTLPHTQIQTADGKRIAKINDERKQKVKQHSIKLWERHQTIVNEYPDHNVLIKLLNLDDHYYIGRDECKALGVWGDTIRLTEDRIRSMLHKTNRPIVIVRDKLNTPDDNPTIIYPTTPHNQRTEQRAETTPNRLAIVPISPIITRIETTERWRVNSNAIVLYCPPKLEMVVYTPPTPKPTPPNLSAKTLERLRK